MPPIKPADMRFLDEVLQMQGGYVLDFSDRTFGEFFDSTLGIDMDDERYRDFGRSKGKRLRRFLAVESGHVAGRALRELWEYRDAMPGQSSDQDYEPKKQRYFEIVARVEGTSNNISLTGAVDRFTHDETLDELVASIERDVAANKAQVALDRLHTYCMKKFAHLLRQRGEEEIPDTLNGRAGRYFNPIRKAGVRPITDKIMRSSIEILELFNGIRNNESLAHDNKLVDSAEARYIFDSIVSMLRFLKAHEPDKYGA